MSAPDFASMAERLHDSSDEDRYALFCKAAGDRTARRELCEAVVVTASAGAVRRSEAEPTLSEDEIAVELSRGRIPRAALTDMDTVEWLLASLAQPADDAAVASASAATRRAVRSIVRPVAPRRRAWLWLPALGAGAVAVLMFVLWSPAQEPWARSLNLSRGQVWRMSDVVASGVQTTVETGKLAAPLFDLPPVPSRRQRNESLFRHPPRIESPRWEAIAEPRPEFRWNAGSSAGEYEVMLLGPDRKVVWAATTEAESLAYPADQPPLRAGDTYYWKVNRLDPGAIVASPFVAFQVLGEDQRRAFESEIREVRSNSFLRGSVLDRHGLYTRAADAFEDAKEDSDLRPRALAAYREVRAKQGLDE